MLVALNREKNIAMQNIRIMLLATAVAGCLSTPLSACADETIPADWCMDPKSSPKVIKSFDFDEKQLAELYDRCGVVDDHHDDWHAARLASQFYCDTLVAKDLRGKMLVVPVVTGPNSFNDEAHHSIYRMDQGLTGACVVCVPPTK